MLHLNTCCCTCLSYENLRSVHIKDADDVKIIDKLMFCITDKDSIYECAPLLICDKCHKNLNEMFHFKRNSLKNLELFKNCLKQLIKNPFFELTLNEPVATTVVSPMCPPVEQVNNDVVKIEVESDENNSTATESEVKEVQPEPSESSSSTNFVIQTIESLNNNKKYENPVSKNVVKSIGKYTKAAKKSCQTCGKQFIRIDYYRNHVSACSKNQLILATMRNNTVLPKRKKIFKRKTDDSDDDDDDEEMPRRRKRLKKLERTYCNSCKKSVAVRFLSRHHKVCPERNSN